MTNYTAISLSHLQRSMLAVLLLALLLPAVALAAPGWMGVGIGEITPERVAALKLKEERGVEVLAVTPDSPAAQAGLKQHDVILEYNGTRVDSAEQCQRLVRETPAGRPVRLLISREGATQTVQLKLVEKRGAAAFEGKTFEFHMPKIEIPEIHVNPDINILFKTTRLGIDGQSLGKQLGDYFGVPNAEGVLVTSVEKDSAADKAGIKAGDVIVKMDGEKVTGMRDLRNLLRDKSSKASLALVLIRNKREMTVTANLERRERGDVDLLKEKVDLLRERVLKEKVDLRKEKIVNMKGGQKL